MNPLPEGFKLKLVVTKLKYHRRLDYLLITPSHPSGFILTNSAGIIMASLLTEYERPVLRSHMFKHIWGDAEDGGPLAWEKVIDVILCRTRRVMRLKGIDFDYRGDWRHNGLAALKLSNLRECEPYGTPIKVDNGKYIPVAEKRAREAAKMGRDAEAFARATARKREGDALSLAAAKIQSQSNAVDYKLMKAKEAFNQHQPRPITDLWSHNARAERSIAKVGEPV